MDLPPVLHFEVSPSSPSANFNMTVILQVAYDNDKSILPVIHLILKSRNSVLIPHLNSIKLSLLQKARKYIGRYNITDILVKCLRRTLNKFQIKYTKNSKAVNDNIVLTSIFEYLDLATIVETLPLVSKAWYKASNSDLLWYALYECYFPFETQQIERILTGPWKTLFLTRDFENTNRLLNETGWRILTVHKRIGTADLWGEERSWQEYVKQSILSTCSNGVNGTFMRSSNSVGSLNKFLLDEADPAAEYEGVISEWQYGWKSACYIKCYSLRAAKRFFGAYVQARIRKLEDRCPFVGNMVGILCYQANYKEFEKNTLIRATRGLQIVPNEVGRSYPRIRSIIMEKLVKVQEGQAGSTLLLLTKNCFFLEPFSPGSHTKYCHALARHLHYRLDQLYKIWVLYFYEK